MQTANVLHGETPEHRWNDLARRSPGRSQLREQLEAAAAELRAKNEALAREEGDLEQRLAKEEAATAKSAGDGEAL